MSSFFILFSCLHLKILPLFSLFSNTLGSGGISNELSVIVRFGEHCFQSELSLSGADSNDTNRPCCWVCRDVVMSLDCNSLDWLFD